MLLGYVGIILCVVCCFFGFTLCVFRVRDDSCVHVLVPFGIVRMCSVCECVCAAAYVCDWSIGSSYYSQLRLNRASD